jgi:hypothetical protein
LPPLPGGASETLTGDNVPRLALTGLGSQRLRYVHAAAAQPE